MMRPFNFLLLLLAFTAGCKQKTNTSKVAPVAQVKTGDHKKALCCESNIPSRFASLQTAVIAAPGINNEANKTHAGMVWIKPGTFLMGADNKQAADDEYPKHKVTVGGFWMDITTVTNAQFAKFLKATGYITTAGRKADRTH